MLPIILNTQHTKTTKMQRFMTLSVIYFSPQVRVPNTNCDCLIFVREFPISNINVTETDVILEDGLVNAKYAYMFLFVKDNKYQTRIR